MNSLKNLKLDNRDYHVSVNDTLLIIRSSFLCFKIPTFAKRALNVIVAMINFNTTTLISHDCRIIGNDIEKQLAFSVLYSS